MSIRVLKAKAQSRRLVTEKNSRAMLPVNLNYSGSSKLCCPQKINGVRVGNPVIPSGGIYVPKAPAPQKSYRNYNRQAMLGYTGLAGRIVSLRNSQTNEVISIPERNTYKRMPEFSQGQRLYNLSNEAVRCKDNQTRCKPVSPKCYNNGESCGKSKISITKDIGFLSSGEYLKRRIARRVLDTSQPYELKPAPAANVSLTC